MTVSRALRDDTNIRDETRKQIRAVARDMGYIPDSGAANLRQRRSGFVAMTIPSLNNANFADTAQALSRQINAAGLELLLAATDYDAAREEELVARLLQRRPEALVLTGGHHTDQLRTMVAQAGIPVVETWDLPTAPLGHVVGFSNANAAGQLVDHLVASGYSRIAYLGGDAARDTRGADRRRGFLAAMARNNLPATRIVDAGVPPIAMSRGAEAMATLLDRHPDAEAVVCVADPAAFGALSECQRRGISVPDDLAIVGFGAYDIAAVSVPSLTTIDPDPRAIGERAGSLIVELLRGDAPEAGQWFETELTLRIGGSTRSNADA